MYTISASLGCERYFAEFAEFAEFADLYRVYFAGLTELID